MVVTPRALANEPQRQHHEEKGGVDQLEFGFDVLPGCSGDFALWTRALARALDKN